MFEVKHEDASDQTVETVKPVTTKTMSYILIKSHAVVYSHTWTIKNISGQLKHTSVLSSSKFGENPTSMSLQLLNMDTDGYRGFIGLKLIFDENGNPIQSNSYHSNIGQKTDTAEVSISNSVHG